MDQIEGISSGETPVMLQWHDDRRDRRHSLLGESINVAISLALLSLPSASAVSSDAPLSSATAASPPDDGADRLSSLPDRILKDVVSRLPPKDAARTAALATRWRGLWLSVPLVFDDAHLVPDSSGDMRRLVVDDDNDASCAVVAAVSGALAAHPGPFRFVRLTWSHMASHLAEMARWLQLLAAKGIEELDFINRPWPLDLHLPSSIFSCTSLTRLHLGVCKFPDTAAVPRAAAFPHLKEIFLTVVRIPDQDLAFLLSCCPVLENLTIISNRITVRVRLVSRTLRYLQLLMSSVTDITVEDAPSLERIILVAICGQRNGATRRVSRVRIGNAPNLRMLGHWRPGENQLEIGSAVIKAGTKVTPSTMVPSVRILSLEVQFEIRNEVKMLPSLLKCFPKLEALHTSSLKVNKSTGKVNLKFWQEAGTVECVEQHVKKLVFHDFQGKKSELAFLKFVAEKARMLDNMVIMLCSGCFSQENDVNAKLRPLSTAKWASEDFKLIVSNSPVSDGGPRPWNFRMVSEYTCSDPFDRSTSELTRDAYVFHQS